MAPRSLLDFITTLVHDPAAAAAYRADPHGVLRAADLPDVTTADIDHLIPVVADSAGGSSFGSIWSAGDAAHSFDAAFEADGVMSGATQPAAPGGSPAFDPFSVPDTGLDREPDDQTPEEPAFDWGADAESTAAASSDDLLNPAGSGSDLPPDMPAGPDWSGAVAVDDLGVDDQPATVEQPSFDDF